AALQSQVVARLSLLKRRNLDMASPDIVGWFDDNWMNARERAQADGFEALGRPDQVLAAVGFLFDSFIGDGVLAIVDGVVQGSDEGLTVKMPDALDEIGLSDAAEHVRQIIRLRQPTGSAAKDGKQRTAALEHWSALHALFDETGPDGERVMLTRLY